jgi:hypothetical protein
MVGPPCSCARLHTNAVSVKGGEGRAWTRRGIFSRAIFPAIEFPQILQSVQWLVLMWLVAHQSSNATDPYSY